MDILTIDIDAVVAPRLDMMRPITEHIPDILNHSGIALIVPIHIIKSLKSLPRGLNRLLFINTHEFLSLIQDFCLFNYSDNLIKVFFTDSNIQYLSMYFHALLTIPSNPVIVTSINPSDIHTPLFKALLIEGISSVYMCHSTEMCLYRDNNTPFEHFIDMDRVNYVINSTQQNSCNLTMKFDKATAKFLKTLSKTGHTLDKNGKLTQKEIGGSLRLLKDTIILKAESVTTGDKEGIDIDHDIYNFHSHPEEAYINHSTHIGWPSCQDYLGFLGSVININAIMHVVATIEGVYIMSLAKEWTTVTKSHLKKQTKYIRKNYNIAYKQAKTPAEYIDIIHSIPQRIFIITFLTWKDAIAGKRFKVDFSKTDNNCVLNITDLNHFKHNIP